MAPLPLPFPASIEEVTAFAQRRANAEREAFGVYEHVGVYGSEHGDIQARHVFKALAFNKGEPSNEWALRVCVDPEGV